MAMGMLGGMMLGRPADGHDDHGWHGDDDHGWGGDDGAGAAMMAGGMIEYTAEGEGQCGANRVGPLRPVNPRAAAERSVKAIFVPVKLDAPSRHLRNRPDCAAQHTSTRRL